MVEAVRIRPACGLARGDQARLVWAVRDGSAVLLPGLLLAGAVGCTCPVFLADAVPRTVAVVSGLAQRLGLDSADSVEVIGCEGGEPGRLCVDVGRAPLPVVVSWGHRRPWRPVEAAHNCQAPGTGGAFAPSPFTSW